MKPDLEKKSVQGGKSKRDRSNVKMYNARMQKETNFVDILTQVVCLEHAILHSVVVEFVHECKDLSVLSADAFVRVLQIMMTPPKRGNGECHQEVADRVQSFFERLLRRTIRNGEENTFDMFKTATMPKADSKNVTVKTEGEGGRNRGSGSKAGKKRASSKNAHAKTPPREDKRKGNDETKSVHVPSDDTGPDPPPWLVPNGQVRYSSNDHVAEARRIEAIGGKKKISERRSEIGLGVKAPGQDDIAVFICRMAFQKLTTFLNDSRKCVDRVFFEDFGHLFASWKSVEDQCIEQSKLRLT